MNRFIEDLPIILLSATLVILSIGLSVAMIITAVKG